MEMEALYLPQSYDTIFLMFNFPSRALYFAWFSCPFATLDRLLFPVFLLASGMPISHAVHGPTMEVGWGF